jgi:cytochrome c oxidase subunit 2
MGKKIFLQMTSKDVIHAFYLPNARIKADAIPGRFSKLWFDANKPGDYEIACAEMCGTHHYLMKAQLTVLTQEDFSSWINESQKMAIATNDTEDVNLRWGWKWGSK